MSKNVPLTTVRHLLNILYNVGYEQNNAKLLRTVHTAKRGCADTRDYTRALNLIRYDVRSYFNVNSKADRSQLNLLHAEPN